MKDIDELEKLVTLREKGVLTEHEYELARQQIVGKLYEPDKAPAWMKPWGYYTVLITLGLTGLIAYPAISKADAAAMAVTILLNPVFFIGMPLGLYWLYRSGEIGNPSPPVMRPVYVVRPPAPEPTPPPVAQTPPIPSNPPDKTPEPDGSKITEVEKFLLVLGGMLVLGCLAVMAAK